MDVSDAIHPDQRVCSRQDHRSRGWINPRIGCHSWIFCRLVKHLRASIHGSASRDERYPFCCKEADGFAAPTASSSSSDVAARDAATKACGRFTKCPRKRSRSKPWSQAEGCATRLFFASERSGLAGDGTQGQSPSDHSVEGANSGQRAAILFTLGAHDMTLRYRTANEERNPREDDQRLIQQTEPSTCSRLTAPQLDQTISGAVPEVGRDLHRSPHRAD